MHNDNKGMSLVEIMVVIAILSVLTGVVGYGISLSTSRDVDACAQKLLSGIQHTRTVTMGKKSASINIGYDNDRIKITETSILIKDDGTDDVNAKGTIVGKKGIVVNYILEDGTTGALGSSLELEFDRASGALSKTRINGANSALCKELKVSRGAYSATVEIVPLTGKVTMKD